MYVFCVLIIHYLAESGNYKKMKKKTKIFAVSGVKNSGKTTLISRILPILSDYGLKVATIKHDGHDFDADVPGTDTYRHFQAGAYGTAVFSDSKYMVVKQQPKVTQEQMMLLFPEADLILLEGFKTCSYPKIELIRRGNSVNSVCEGCHLAAVATDMEPDELVLSDRKIPLLDLNDPKAVADFILAFGEE